jgi:mono/diheme cytochrome c family protein
MSVDVFVAEGRQAMVSKINGSFGSANAEAFSTAQLSDADLALIVAYIRSLSS